MEAVYKNNLALSVHDHQNGEIFDFRQVEASVVAFVGNGVFKFSFRDLPNEAEHLPTSFKELSPKFLTEDPLGQSLTLRLDLLAAEKRVLPGGTVPALVFRVLPLSTAEKVVEPAFALRRRYQERPTLPVDQALGEVAFPNAWFHSRGLIDDHPVEALAEERDGVVGALPTDLTEPTRHVPEDELFLVVLERHDPVAEVLGHDDDDLAEDLVAQVIRWRDDPADRSIPRFHGRSESLHGGAAGLSPPHAGSDDPP